MKLFQAVKKNFLWLTLIILVPLLFFYQTVFFAKIPFPGDLLVAHHEPYKSYSHLGYSPGAVPHKAQGPDVIKELLPWKYFAVSSLKKGEIPFWNPYNFSGNPLMANFQSAVFYPGNIFFLILPFDIAWSLFILSSPILSSFGLLLNLGQY